MSSGAAQGRPTARFGGPRSLCLATGVAAGLVVVLPPLAGLAHRYVLVEAVQFSVFAMVVPALVVLGEPPVHARPARPGTRRDGPGRLGHLEPGRGAICLVAFVAAVVAWRTPIAVDAIDDNAGLVVAQALSLVVVGGALWYELVGPGALGSPRPLRAVIAAVAMWTVWIVSYLAGFSSGSWYSAFRHVAGRGLSAAADQQFATGILWLAAAVCFSPVVFWNVLAWIRSEDRDMGLDSAVAARGPMS